MEVTFSMHVRKSLRALKDQRFDHRLRHRLVLILVVLGVILKEIFITMFKHQKELIFLLKNFFKLDNGWMYKFSEGIYFS